MVTMTSTLRSDTEVKRDVEAELKFDYRIHDNNIGVAVHNGVVTLAGTAESAIERLAAGEAAHRVLGVLDVANDVQVKIPGSNRKTDGEIAEAVRSALEWNVLVPDRNIRTTVTDGWVTLEGEVDTLAQCHAADECIRPLVGVVGITNKLSVTQNGIKAAAIRRTIEDALDRRARRESRHVDVDVKDGVVTLSGTVHSWGDRIAIEQAARHAHGATQVVSRLSVDIGA